MDDPQRCVFSIYRMDCTLFGITITSNGLVIYEILYLFNIINTVYIHVVDVFREILSIKSKKKVFVEMW